MFGKKKILRWRAFCFSTCVRLTPFPPPPNGALLIWEENRESAWKRKGNSNSPMRSGKLWPAERSIVGDKHALSKHHCASNAATPFQHVMPHWYSAIGCTTDLAGTILIRKSLSTTFPTIPKPGRSGLTQRNGKTFIRAPSLCCVVSISTKNRLFTDWRAESCIQMPYQQFSRDYRITVTHHRSANRLR